MTSNTKLSVVDQSLVNKPSFMYDFSVEKQVLETIERRTIPKQKAIENEMKDLSIDKPDDDVAKAIAASLKEY